MTRVSHADVAEAPHHRIEATAPMKGAKGPDFAHARRGSKAGSSEKKDAATNPSATVFQCCGFGDCRMVFTRSEHLARHVRWVRGADGC